MQQVFHNYLMHGSRPRDMAIIFALLDRVHSMHAAGYNICIVG